MKMICYFDAKRRITRTNEAKTINTDSDISTIRNILATPRTCENEKKGNNRESIGSHATGLLTRFLINIIVSQEKKIDNIIT
jgi:hypothetical protein